MSITLEETIEAAQELAEGDNPPNVKFALWIAALSTQQTLEKNARLAELLRVFIFQPLPEHETLFRYLKQSKAVLYKNHLKSLYYTEYLEKCGMLEGLEDIGTTYEDQVAWRDRVFKLCHGHGLSWKTISFAALLIDPMHSELSINDRHVMMRLGYNTKRSPATRNTYLAVEKQVIQEREENGYARLPLALFHWWKWEEYRETHVSRQYRKAEHVESHALLSPRMYTLVSNRYPKPVTYFLAKLDKVGQVPLSYLN